ncbi:MAG: nuclear transport factor 2 family protein [Actinomycetota bacterium]
MNNVTDDRRTRADRVIDALLDSLRRNDMRAFAGQWAPDGSMEFPFAAPGYPVLRSRADVENYLKDYSAMLRVDTVTERQRHHTLDPDTVILEFSADGLVLQSNSTYHMDYVAVITVGPEGVRHYRDYWNPVAAAAALGDADALAANVERRDA